MEDIGDDTTSNEGEGIEDGMIEDGSEMVLNDDSSVFEFRGDSSF